jgi:hypothetical protein
VLYAARAAGAIPIDTVLVDISDLDALAHRGGGVSQSLGTYRILVNVAAAVDVNGGPGQVAAS